MKMYNVNAVYFLSCKCNKRFIETQIGICGREITCRSLDGIILVLHLEDLKPHFQNALSHLLVLALSPRHIRSIKKIGSIMPNLSYENCVLAMRKLQFKVQFLVFIKLS